MRPKKNNKPVAPEVDQETIEVSNKIQKILEESNYALQTFMEYSQFGIAPRVRLVRAPKTETTNETNQGTDSKETTGGEDTVEPSTDKQS